jgi:hypothetical protein
MSDNDDDLLVLHGKRFWKQSRWSKDKGVNVRTTARHRQKGLAWLSWGGEVWIPEDDGDAYIASLVKRPNPPRRKRRAISTTGVSATT